MAQKRLTKRKLILDLVDNVTSMGLKLAAAVFILALGYLIYGLAAQNGLLRLGSLPLADQKRVLSNVATACALVRISGTVFAACVIGRYYVEETLGYILALLGALLYVGTPWLFSVRFGLADPSAKLAIAIILSGIRSLGAVILVAGMVLMAWSLLSQARTAISRLKSKAPTENKEKAEEAVEPYRPRLYAKCWQMPYCHRFVRNNCPTYAARKSCWRLKSGCICDKDIIDKAIGINSVEGIMLTGDLQSSKSPGHSVKLSAAGKRARCRTCIIYEFHQKQKYKLISPLVFPAVLLPIWLLYAKLEAFFGILLGVTDRFMRTVTFLPQSQSHIISQSAVPEYVPMLFVVWLAIISISCALLFAEFCIFKLRI
ncbi:MAG: hypothetical protein ABFD64_08150 [Armatimonadota bacterium]